jgi:hypothetical protein
MGKFFKKAYITLIGKVKERDHFRSLHTDERLIRLGVRGWIGFK